MSAQRTHAWRVANPTQAKALSRIGYYRKKGYPDQVVFDIVALLSEGVNSKDAQEQAMAVYRCNADALSCGHPFDYVNPYPHKGDTVHCYRCHDYVEAVKAMLTPEGWKVEAPLKSGGQSKGLTIIHVYGREFWVKRGGHGAPVAMAMQWLIQSLGHIETLRPAHEAWSGCYDYRPVTDGTSWSEHAAGTALDWNASLHPRGSHYGGWAVVEQEKIRALLNTRRGRVFKWGADFHTTPDPMHFELRSPNLFNANAGLWK